MKAAQLQTSRRAYRWLRSQPKWDGEIYLAVVSPEFGTSRDNWRAARRARNLVGYPRGGVRGVLDYSVPFGFTPRQRFFLGVHEFDLGSTTLAEEPGIRQWRTCTRGDRGRTLACARNLAAFCRAAVRAGIEMEINTTRRGEHE